MYRCTSLSFSKVTKVQGNKYVIYFVNLSGWDTLSRIMKVKFNYYATYFTYIFVNYIYVFLLINKVAMGVI